MNVLLVVMLIWVMFAILAVNMLKRKTNYCEITDN